MLNVEVIKLVTVVLVTVALVNMFAITLVNMVTVRPNISLQWFHDYYSFRDHGHCCLFLL